jgi:hypothetical protein
MRKTQNYLVIGCILLFIFGSSLGFWAITNSNESNADIVSGTGKIVFLDFEGGFYGIITDSGAHYDPRNLPDKFKIDGLSIVFIAEVLHGVSSIHMWGEIVELIYINYDIWM